MKNSVLFWLCLMVFKTMSAQTFTNPLNIPPAMTGPNFNLRIHDTIKEFIPGFPANTIGINTSDYMGPTLIFNQGETVTASFLNATAQDSVTVHWHGFHIPAMWDGGPMSEFVPGATWTPTFTVTEHASTMWYHSHAHERTNIQVGRGLAGLIINRDTIESQLNLPRTYGTDDFPLIIQDKTFHTVSGDIEPDFLGDTMVINGTLNAYLECPKQVLRFRMLNASTERVYNIGFNDNRNFYQIGTDGGLLEAPVSLNRLVLSPGERAELLFDFTAETIGNNLFLMSYSTEFGGTMAGSCTSGPACGNGPLDSTDFWIMRLNIIAQTGGAVTAVPGSLVTIDWLNEANVDTTRIKALLNPASPGAPFSINGVLFDMGTVNDIVPVGNTEIWRFENHSQLGHPMHIHDTQFNILRINGAAPPANLQGWKDVVLVYPGDTVEVLAEFTDYTDPMYTYMMHCHALSHEDNGMMHQFLVVDTGATAVQDPLVENIGMTVFPNPASDDLYIQLENEYLRGMLVIRNESGQEIAKYGFQGNVRMDVSKLAAGVYLLSFYGEKGQFSQMKFLKE